VQRSATVQEERVTDIRRHNMMIMDILNGTQETTHKSLECIQNFTRAELLRDPAAQLETSVREVLFRQMGKLKESLLGEGSADDQGLNLKDLVSSMATRLEASAERLELSQANAPAALDVEETIKRELEAVTLALATQQRENGQESHTHLGELLREELTALKDAQSASAASLQEKVGEWTNSLSENVSRVESGLEKVLQSVESQEKDKTRRSQNPPPADERAKTVRGEPASGPALDAGFWGFEFWGLRYLRRLRCTPFRPPFGFFGMASCESLRNRGDPTEDPNETPNFERLPHRFGRLFMPFNYACGVTSSSSVLNSLRGFVPNGIRPFAPRVAVKAMLVDQQMHNQRPGGEWITQCKTITYH
ncbi:unnamed protein product, partial [Symbiodinium sp. KB8]